MDQFHYLNEEMYEPGHFSRDPADNMFRSRFHGSCRTTPIDIPHSLFTGNLPATSTPISTASQCDIAPLYNPWTTWSNFTPQTPSTLSSSTQSPTNSTMSSVASDYWTPRNSPPPPIDCMMTPPQSPLYLDCPQSKATSGWTGSSNSPILTTPIWTPTKTEFHNLMGSPVSPQWSVPRSRIASPNSPSYSSAKLAAVMKDFSKMSLFSEHAPEPLSGSASPLTTNFFPIGIWSSPSNPSADNTTPTLHSPHTPTSPRSAQHSRFFPRAQSPEQLSATRFYTPRSNYSNASGRRRYNSGASDAKEASGPRECNYCKKNKESPTVYMSHSLHRFENGRRLVICPILQQVVCPVCRATGEAAHSEAYCPYKPGRDGNAPLVLKLLSGRTSSNTKRRELSPPDESTPRVMDALPPLAMDEIRSINEFPPRANAGKCMTSPAPRRDLMWVP